MPIVWKRPDGSLNLTQESVLEARRTSGETTQALVARLVPELQAAAPVLASCVPFYVPTENMPVSRVNRPAWRLNATNDTVIIDVIVLAAQTMNERDQEATKLPLWDRAVLRVIASKLQPPMTPQALIQAVRDEYRSLLEQ